MPFLQLQHKFISISSAYFISYLTRSLAEFSKQFPHLQFSTLLGTFVEKKKNTNPFTTSLIV